jgi:hypothetical protein
LREPSWLHDDLGGAQRHGLASLFPLGMSRQDHDLKVRMVTPDPGENSQTAEPRHDEVEENPLNGSRLQHQQALVPVEGYQRLMAKAPDRFRDHFGHRGIVVYHQDPHGYRRVPVSGPAAVSSRPREVSR